MRIEFVFEMILLTCRHVVEWFDHFLYLSFENYGRLSGQLVKTPIYLGASVLDTRAYQLTIGGLSIVYLFLGTPFSGLSLACPSPRDFGSYFI